MAAAVAVADSVVEMVDSTIEVAKEAAETVVDGVDETMDVAEERQFVSMV
jgi:hypothetical protein